jgi:cystathionine beta-lyase
MDKDWSTFRPDTRLAHAGRDPAGNHGVVNPPVYHASTILFPTLDAFEAAERGAHPRPVYGRQGTHTHFALEEALVALEGGDEALILPSGLAAVAIALTAYVAHGDDILISDSAYGPTRRLAKGLLRRMGVATRYYDPLIGAGISELIQPNTKLILCESPGSLTFEIQDIPAIVEAAHAKGVKVAMDNTWATPLFFRPLDFGVDVSISAGTKYLVGHADAMIGTLAFRSAEASVLKNAVTEIGFSTGPDDCYLALRGLRTLGVRLERHQATGIALAEYLAGRKEVVRILHPALPTDPGHALWERDFKGASGLFSILLKPCPRAGLAALIDGLKLFGVGYSWGGYESLLLPTHPKTVRTARPWTAAGPLLRVHAGLEDPADLIDDLGQGLDRLTKASEN